MYTWLMVFFSRDFETVVYVYVFHMVLRRDCGSLKIKQSRHWLVVGNTFLANGEFHCILMSCFFESFFIPSSLFSFCFLLSFTFFCRWTHACWNKSTKNKSKMNCLWFIFQDIHSDCWEYGFAFYFDEILGLMNDFNRVFHL